MALHGKPVAPGPGRDTACAPRTPPRTTWRWSRVQWPHRGAPAEKRNGEIWGTPWQPWFWDWAFNAPQRDGETFLASKFEAIPAGTDIVLAHGPRAAMATAPARGRPRPRRLD